MGGAHGVGRRQGGSCSSAPPCRSRRRAPPSCARRYFDAPARSDALLALYRLVRVRARSSSGARARSEAAGGRGGGPVRRRVLRGVACGRGRRSDARGARPRPPRPARSPKLRALVERYRERECVAAGALRPRRPRATASRGARRTCCLLIVAQGRTQPEIARELCVSRDTVKTHVRNLYRKMGVSGKAELAEAMSRRRAGPPARLSEPFGRRRAVGGPAGSAPVARAGPSAAPPAPFAFGFAAGGGRGKGRAYLW